jgi:hypothetical protein
MEAGYLMKRLIGTIGNPYARMSLISITLTALITSIHHIYRLGPGLIIPTMIITLLPYALMRWFNATEKKAALLGYGLVTTLIFVWFGLIDGFLDHVMKALGLQNTTFLPGGEEKVVKTVFSLWSPEAGNIFYEWTGILTFIIGTFAVYYGYQFIRTSLQSGKSVLRQTV